MCLLFSMLWSNTQQEQLTEKLILANSLSIPFLWCGGKSACIAEVRAWCLHHEVPALGI